VIIGVFGTEKGHDMNTGMKFLLAIFLTASSAAAQTEVKPAAGAGAALPTADEVVDKYATAIGGKEAYEKLSSRLSKGTFELPAMGASGSIEIHAKAPNKTISIIDIPGFGLISRCYDGTTAWSQDPQTGIRELTGNERAVQKRGADFFQAVKLKEIYPKREVKGKEKVGDREAYLIEAMPTEGGPVKMYFDTENGLLTKIQFDAETAQGTLDVQTMLADYKEVDGVKLAFTIRQVAGALDFVIKIQEVTHNVPIDDEKFKKPEK
jgi:outer membrane lipoprotein-sorting protein